MKVLTKNKVLKLITAISLLTLIVFGSALDSETMIPYIVCLIADIWLLTFALVNKEVIGG
jgi:hypothetical protein